MNRLMLLRADARSLPLTDASVDLVVTSPPYFGLRSYEDAGQVYPNQIGSESSPHSYLDALLHATRECARVVKTTGSIWVNLGDRYSTGAGENLRATTDELDQDGETSETGADRLSSIASRRGVRSTPRKSLLGLPWRYALRCIDELGLILRAELVWSKTNGLPESVTDRVRRSHETWFHLTREASYYSALDAVRELYTGSRALRRRIKKPGAGKHAQRAAWLEEHPRGRTPGSVWEVPTQPLRVPAELGIDHYAAFPMEWPRRLISAWCPPEGVVLDPFGGTGTTALVASVLGRTGISVEASADYCRLARWRCQDPAEVAKAAQVKAPPQIVPGQRSLFDQSGQGSGDSDSDGPLFGEELAGPVGSAAECVSRGHADPLNADAGCIAQVRAVNPR